MERTARDGDDAVVLTRARVRDRPILRRLLELYQYDLTRVGGHGPDQRARFGYRHLNAYWKERGRHAYLAKIDGQWAGFALVNKRSPLESADWWMAEFFVLAALRRRGVGARIARAVFARHPGRWHVGQLAANRAAQAFWRHVIGRVSRANHREVHLDDDRWHGPIQIFSVRARP